MLFSSSWCLLLLRCGFILVSPSQTHPVCDLPLNPETVFHTHVKQRAWLSAFLRRVLEVYSSKVARRQINLTCRLGHPQPLQVNVIAVLLLRPKQLFSERIPNHSSLIIISFNDKETELLTVSLNKIK